MESRGKQKDIRDFIVAELNLKKVKKNKKSWRFAYDMYCKEIKTGKDQVTLDCNLMRSSAYGNKKNDPTSLSTERVNTNTKT